MGRILVSAGNTPITSEAMRLLGQDIRDQLGGEHEISTLGPYEERGGGPIDPFIEVVLMGIQAAATIISIAVSAWRARDKAPPRKIVRVVVIEEDQEGNRRQVWVESED